MSDIVRDNELKALARMQCTYDIMRSVFPSDKVIMSSWHKLTKETQTLIGMQEESIKRFDKTE